MKHVVLSINRYVVASAAVSLGSLAPAVVVAAEARVDLRLVARRGDPAPGVPGKTFHSLSSDGPLMSPGGHVAFVANTASASNTAGIWVGRPGELGLVAHEPGQAAGLPAGTTYRDLRGLVSVDDAGHVGFWGYPGSSSWTAFWGAPGEVTALLREDFEVPWVLPGILGGLYLNAPYLGGGTAVLSASTTASTGHGSVGIWQTTPTGLQLIMRQGASAPGMLAGAVFDGSNGTPYRPLVNASGDVAFAAAVAGGGVDYLSNDRGIWVRRNGVLSLAFRANAPVSGFGINVTLRYPRLSSIGNSGDIAFFGDLFQNGIGIVNGRSLWCGKSGDFRLVARNDSPLPGLPAGVTVSVSDSTSAMVAGDYVGFAAYVSGAGVSSANDRGFFMGPRDAVRCIIREGVQVPGMEPGVVFTDLLDGFAMNARGQIVFRATISGPGITSANNVGIWATDTRGTMLQIAREGVPVSATNAAGVPVPLDPVRFGLLADSGGEDGSATSINAAGQIAFYMYVDPSQTSSDATIIRADIIEPCVGDFNSDGFLDFEDFDAFVAAFEAGAASSDITGNGFLDFEDFDSFVAAFEAGCG